jgi:hypothetical protein
MCGTISNTWVYLQNGNVAIMCWDHCGMDYDVNGIWFMLNRLEAEEE